MRPTAECAYTWYRVHKNPKDTISIIKYTTRWWYCCKKRWKKGYYLESYSMDTTVANYCATCTTCNLFPFINYSKNIFTYLKDEFLSMKSRIILYFFTRRYNNLNYSPKFNYEITDDLQHISFTFKTSSFWLRPQGTFKVMKDSKALTYSG